MGTIRKAGHRLPAAEEKICLARIANRPTACLFGELQQTAPLSDRDDVVNNFGFRLDLVFEGGCKRSVAPHSRARDSYHVWMSSCLSRSRSCGCRRLGATRKP